MLPSTRGSPYVFSLVYFSMRQCCSCLLCYNRVGVLEVVPQHLDPHRLITRGLQGSSTNIIHTANIVAKKQKTKQQE